MNIDPSEIGKNYPVAVGLVGNARRVLMEITYQLDRDVRWIARLGGSPTPAETADTTTAELMGATVH